MSRSAPTILFSPVSEGREEFNRWKDTRSEYVQTLGHVLLVCSEADIVRIFDEWEAQIRELEKSDRGHLTALMTISLLHYFNRSNDQVKERVPFITRMLEHRSKPVVCAAAQVFSWLASEQPDNIEFMRDLVSTKASVWICSSNRRFAAMQILAAAGEFILPSVFEVTSNNFSALWAAVTGDDLELRLISAKVFYLHLQSLPEASANKTVDSILREWTKAIKTSQAANHGCILICGSLVKLYPEVIDRPELLSTLLDSINPKSELLAFSAFELLLEMAKTAFHIFTPDNLGVLFGKLTAACQRHISSTRLYELIAQFLVAMWNVSDLCAKQQLPLVLSFLKNTMKHKAQQRLGFTLLGELYRMFGTDVPMDSSFFLEAEPSPEYVSTLRMRMAMFKDVKHILMKSYLDGLGPKVSENQAALSLHILQAFDVHLFDNKDEVFQQIRGFTKSQYEKVRLLVTTVLPLFSQQEAMDDLLYLALVDESKLVREAAVSQLKKPERLARCEMVTQILSDSSYKVKRKAIPLIASVAPLNPMMFHVPIVSFIQQVMLSMASSSNPCTCARISTLLPLIAQYFIKFCTAFVPQIAHICFEFLDGANDHHISDHNHDDHDGICIASVIHRDMSLNNQANRVPIDAGCPNLLRIFHIKNQEFIEERDANLFKTLFMLAEYLRPFLTDLIPIFVRVFASQRSNSVYSSALDALTQIVLAQPEAASLPSDCPDLIPTLMTLLQKKPSEDVAKKILTLMGTFGVTSFPRSIVDGATENDPMTDFDFKSSSFYTDFTMNLLLRVINDPHSSIFEAITSVFVKEADFAAKFLDQIVSAFTMVLATAKDQQKDTLFNQLEIISYFSGAKMEPHVTMIIPFIVQNIGRTSALRLACMLSYFLKTEMIPSIQTLYSRAIRQLTERCEDAKYMETLLMFLTYAVILQNQPVDVFIEQCDKVLREGLPTEQMLMIIDSITTIVQLGDASFECSRIARICTRLLKFNIKPQVFQLFYSLAVYCRLPADFIEFVMTNEGIVNPNLAHLREYLADPANTDNTFLVHHNLPISVGSIPDYVPLARPDDNDLFEHIAPPQFNNTAKWLEDLCSTVVASSPSIAIRGCSKIISHSPSFRSEIFPIAFLSCWRNAKKRDKKGFSSVMQSIFESESCVDPALLRLAELLVRAGHPFNISNFTIASACQSPAQALRFLVKHFDMNHYDQRAMELMLTLNMRLGRLHSSRGILKTVNLPTAGHWYEKLGEWESALNIYRQTGSSDPGSLIRCYARLEKWEEIRSMTKVFDGMTTEEKQRNAIWFAWAFYRINDLPRVSYYVKRFSDKADLDQMVFKEIFLIASEQYKIAGNIIDKSLKMLVKDCSVYSSMNSNQADANLMFANNLIELKEALDLKISRSKVVPKIWIRRLSCLNGDSYSWMRLVEIRNLAFKPSENKKSYLKLMSVLIKERRWALVDAFWDSLMDSIHEPVVQIAYAKLLWARDQKAEATEAVHTMNTIYNSTNGIQKVKVARISKSVRETLVNKVLEHGVATQELTPKLRSRLYRLEGMFRIEMYKPSDGKDALVNIINTLEKATQIYPNNYKNWEEFAYAASRVIGDTPYVVKAINGFLKATQLRTVNNLEYLCQLFSLLFRYGGSVEIPSEIVNLGPDVISQILPQIVCQINHRDREVRKVVHEVLVRFSEKHFQAVVFSLHLLTRSEDEQKNKIASDLLKSMAMKHQRLADEADMFVDGLLRCAVTWYEQWMKRLDESFIESRNDHAKGTAILQDLFATRHHPKCQMDIDFVTSMETAIATCEASIKCFVDQPLATEGSFNNLWSQLKRFYEILRRNLKKVETIELSSVSEDLASKRDFVLAIPGAYSVSGNNPIIAKIDPILPVFTTQHRPRLLFMMDTSGRKWKFLLKGNEDLRLDQRIMQFFGLINSLLTSNKATSGLNVSISKYPIVPFAPNAGLISWVTGADTLHQLVMDYRKANGIPPWPEHEHIGMNVGESFDFLNKAQKREIWDMIAPMFPATEFRDLLWERSPNAVMWLRNIETYTLTTALMSMAGYIIGLGDRHPSNIMIQRQTGHVIHIDFGDSFEVALNRERMPEMVPFRLTRMIVNAFGVSGVEGIFRSACESIMRLLRNNKSSIIAQLEIFVHEPIFVNEDNGVCSEGKSSILDRVISKLSGTDPQEDKNVPQNPMTVERQVDTLINIASDPYRYMNHYLGWCQFW